MGYNPGNGPDKSGLKNRCSVKVQFQSVIKLFGRIEILKVESAAKNVLVSNDG